MKNKIYKSIAYAYPTSPNAQFLDHYKTGCFYVEHRHQGLDSTYVEIAHNCEGFEKPDEPDLISLFFEYEGDICPYFLAHGNRVALLAIQNRIKSELERTQELFLKEK